MDEKQNPQIKDKKPKKRIDFRDVIKKTLLWSILGFLLIVVGVFIFLFFSSEPVSDILPLLPWVFLASLILIPAPLVFANAWSKALSFENAPKKSYLQPFIFAIVAPVSTASVISFFFIEGMMFFSLLEDSFVAAGIMVYSIFAGCIAGIYSGTVNGLFVKALRKEYRSKYHFVFSGFVLPVLLFIALVLFLFTLSSTSFFLVFLIVSIVCFINGIRYFRSRKKEKERK